jgi:uncharacterized protein (TIGR01777 family)
MGAFRKESVIDAPASVVGAWHARRGAFERLVPPWDHITREGDDEGIANGSVAHLRMHQGPLSVRWDALHEEVDLPRRFVDVQTRGPFHAWRHEHAFDERDDATLLSDRVTYTLPLRPFSTVAEPFVARMLERMFSYRHRVTSLDLRAHAQFGAEPMKVAITGAGGLVGSALVPFLTTGGHDVVRLVRGASTGAADEVAWDPQRPVLDGRALTDVDAFVHLAGEPIGEGRFSTEQKRRIVESRIEATRNLATAIASLEHKPRVIVSASAIGFYGDRGDEILDEKSAHGTGFLAEVCVGWEQAWRPAIDAGIRVVMLRTGVVLTPRGGALAKLLPVFRLGVGGPVGTGAQWMSTIALDDLLDVVLRALVDERLVGPVNAVGPEPLTNRAFSKTLGRVLSRPAFARVPSAALRIAFGEMAEETILASQRVTPQRLLDVGHRFRFSTVEEALRHVLGR